MTKRIALIDADGILYAAALSGETTCDGAALQLLSLEAIYKNALSRIEQQVRWAKADDAFIILSDRRNFRYDILATYKGQRKASERPAALDGLRARMVEEAPYPVLLIEGLEADDVCGITAGTLMAAGRETVIVSPDKDMATIPGLLLTPMRDGTRSLTLVTQEMADRNHMKQTLMGDTVDNYKGCPGWGLAKTGKLLDLFEEEGLTLAQRWAEVAKAFTDKGLTKEDCLVQARVSRILRVCDWDAVQKEVILFQFPED